ncbi:MAG: hypothetical protein KBA85_06835 [Chloroflexi bacterium]|nr:hypothetical protein [Chloroflexota bacterium]
MTTNKITAVWGASAFVLFYWFVLPAWLLTVSGLLGWSLPFWMPLMARAAIVVLALVWVQRSYLKERHDVAEKGIPLANPGIAVSAKAGQVAVMFQPGDTAVSAAIKQAWGRDGHFARAVGGAVGGAGPAHGAANGRLARLAASRAFVGQSDWRLGRAHLVCKLYLNLAVLS